MSSAEFRELLINCSEKNRISILAYLYKFSQEDGKWRARIITFIKEVWPRQVHVRTPESSRWLADLVLASPDNFTEIIGLIAHTLKPSGEALRSAYKGGFNIDLVRRHPLGILKLLWHILPENVYMWPPDIREWFDALQEHPATSSDERLYGLLRKLEFG